MDLNPKAQEFKELKVALLKAFPKPSAFKEIVIYCCEEFFWNEINNPADYGETVLNAIREAEARGKLRNLVMEALEKNTGNLELRGFAIKYRYIPPPEITINFVVIAMTETQAGLLLSEMPFNDPNIPPLTSRRGRNLPSEFEALKQAIISYGITGLQNSYHATPDEWQPPTYGTKTIRSVIEDTLDKFNKKRESNPDPFSPRLSADFLSLSFLGDLKAWYDTTEKIKREGGILVVDALSLFHGTLYKLLDASKLTSQWNVDTIVLSPISARKIAVNEMIDQDLQDRLEDAFDQFMDKFEPRYELGIGDMLAVQRWLYSRLTTVAHAGLSATPDRRILKSVGKQIQEQTGEQERGFRTLL
jgi:predicted component of type VI protein secretion system